MKLRGAVIVLSVFCVVAVAVTWLVYVTLRRDVAGATDSYTAVVSDAFGLRAGDDVRIAGVRVGRVESVDLDGDVARIAFLVQNDQRLYGNTVASVTYQNIIGQRYLGLSLGKTGSTDVLPAGSVIPLERTVPSFDVGKVLNGYAPLFSTLDPQQVDNLTNGIVASLQGDSASITALVQQSSSLTKTLAGNDRSLGDVITSLNTVAGTLAAQDTNLDSVISQTRQVVTEFNSRRPDLVSSLGTLNHAVQRLSAITDEIYPDLNSLVSRQPGFSKHMVSIEPQLAFLGANLPLALKGLARVNSLGAYATGYVCDLNMTGFFPGLNSVIPVIVDAATPGNRAQHTPRCRNLANG
ncbi:Putative MCE family protein [Mycobacteroides abscessus subsp. bolletii]|uniref:MCE family protein n=1 Tax=Mycobacteroides abscessus TaxID=36809 RepID=UPI0009A78D5C|nr:MlaD family protein [Mycobacteroides abscessus]SKG69351.1 Mce family protein, Mce5B [Mycobacteroides abscessus subsp. bolletii]SLF40485.1 Putative MCE family protein [Mycobacteroides abscessus subsp. bolletii]